MRVHCVGLALVVLVAMSSRSQADYTVIPDTTKGSFCSGIGIKFCSFEKIDATVKGGQLFHRPERFQSVDEYRDNRCWINIRNSWLNWAIGDVPVFYRYVKGPRHELSSYENLGTPDYVVFGCEKQGD
jgi:hypothetical protein